MALLIDMGVVGGGIEILQPMLKNRFIVEFQGLADNAEALTLQVISVDRPKVGFEEVTLDRYNSRAYVAGKHSFETITMTFEADIGGGVAAAIQEQLEFQQRLIGNSAAPRMPTSRSGGRYKFSTVIKQLDGGTTVFEKWNLFGCWLTRVDYGDLDYAASETIKITATLRFDHATQDITGISESAVVGPRTSIP